MESGAGNYVVHACHVNVCMPLVTEPYRLCWVELILRAVHHQVAQLGDLRNAQQGIATGTHPTDLPDPMYGISRCQWLAGMGESFLSAI